MAIITVSVTTGIYFSGGALGVPSELDLTGSLGDDLTMVNGRCKVTIRRHGVQSADPLSGQVLQTLDDVAEVMAVQSLVSFREIDQSGGKLRIMDRKFRVAADDMPWAPAAGNTLQVSGESTVYEVLGPDKLTVQNCWILWCRG